MSCEIEFEKRIPELKAKTNLFSTVKVWDDNKEERSDEPDWTAYYGELLLRYGNEYLESIRDSGPMFQPIDEFEDSWRDGTTAWDTFEDALLSKSWETTQWKDSMLNRIEPLSLRSFQNAEYFSYDTEGHFVFFRDKLSVKAWLEEHIDPIEFVQYVNDLGGYNG